VKVSDPSSAQGKKSKKEKKYKHDREAGGGHGGHGAARAVTGEGRQMDNRPSWMTGERDDRRNDQRADRHDGRRGDRRHDRGDDQRVDRRDDRRDDRGDDRMDDRRNDRRDDRRRDRSRSRSREAPRKRHRNRSASPKPTAADRAKGAIDHVAQVPQGPRHSHGVPIAVMPRPRCTEAGRPGRRERQVGPQGEGGLERCQKCGAVDRKDAGAEGDCRQG
jgi:hypothetical protein